MATWKLRKASDSKAIANLNPDASKLIPLESTSEIQPVPEHATLGESSVMFKQVDSFIQFFKIWPDASRDERLMYGFSLQVKFSIVIAYAKAFGWQYRREFSYWLNTNSSRLQT